jgi:ABC-type bacteriocin/lantibiotic exporter with double-glycine peptidase domain
MPRFQSYRADCGPSALSNALDALGIRRSHDELVTLCGTTADGTTPLQLKRAITALRESCDLAGPGEMKDTHADIALLRLGAVLADGRPSILLVDNWEHWVAVVGRLGHRFLVADSADLRQSISYKPDELALRWLHSGVTRNGFYGIAV